VEEDKPIKTFANKVKLGFSKIFNITEKKQVIKFEESKLEYDEDGIPTNMHLFYNPEVEDIRLDDDIINSEINNDTSNIIE
jgi:hypothetical protein